MQDWSCIDRHTMELTLKLSPSEWPLPEAHDAMFAQKQLQLAF